MPPSRKGVNQAEGAASAKAPHVEACLACSRTVRRLAGRAGREKQDGVTEVSGSPRTQNFTSQDGASAFTLKMKVSSKVVM